MRVQPRSHIVLGGRLHVIREIDRRLDLRQQGNQIGAQAARDAREPALQLPRGNPEGRLSAGANEIRLRSLEREMIILVENGLRREGRAEATVKPLAETIVRRIKRATDPPVSGVAGAAM